MMCNLNISITSRRMYQTEKNKIDAETQDQSNNTLGIIMVLLCFNLRGQKEKGFCETQKGGNNNSDF